MAVVAQEQVQVQVQVCGQQEIVAVPRVGMAELTLAVQHRFDVRPPFNFADRGGRALQDDEALVAQVYGGGLILVQLTEGVMHDLGRRVDQLRHLQWGYLGDRMRNIQQSWEKQNTNLSKLRTVAERDLGSRELHQRELQQIVHSCQELVRKERAARDEAVRNISERVAEVQTATQRGFQDRDIDGATHQRKVADLLQGLEEEREERVKVEASVRASFEELQRTFTQEVVGREEELQKHRRELEGSKVATDASQGSWRAEAAELRQQLASARSAIAAEQRDRAAAIGQTRETIGELQHLISKEVGERETDVQSAMLQLNEVQANATEAKLEMQHMQSELEKRVAATHSSHSEERALRMQSSNDVTQQLEAIRRNFEREQHERDKLGNGINRISQEIMQRINEEVSVREATLGRLEQSLSSEIASTRQEIEQKMEGMMISLLDARLSEAAEARMREQKETQKIISQCVATVQSSGSSYADMAAAHAELSMTLERESEAHAKRFQEVLSRQQEHVLEIDATIDGIHERLKTSFAHMESQIRSSAVDQGEITSSALQELGNSLRQELQTCSESVIKLRDDCKEALHREVRSRMEHDETLQQALEHEVDARHNGVRMLEMSIHELQKQRECLASSPSGPSSAKANSVFVTAAETERGAPRLPGGSSSGNVVATSCSMDVSASGACGSACFRQNPTALVERQLSAGVAGPSALLWAGHSTTERARSPLPERAQIALPSSAGTSMPAMSGGGSKVFQYSSPTGSSSNVMIADALHRQIGSEVNVTHASRYAHQGGVFASTNSTFSPNVRNRREAGH
eukprot:TRINITY_DN49028_c0_g1_i1.p1 TRINITY_DN49028_c0_g1~~TRINITY_DN49028_c0_g1_i1.p1  ORF type:complete len:810 (-),score=175.02 TRINITY_DN49028_c0_g1_i1:50-2479(-)